MIQKSETFALNILEKNEFLIDSGSKGNRNFAVISSYKGQLNKDVVQKGLVYLQQMHPMLQVSIPITIGKATHYIKTAITIPFKEHPYRGPNQWREVVKQDLSQHFTKEDEPLWRVSLLKGNNEGQLIVTLHHGIADAASLMQMMNHLFNILSEILKNKTPTINEISLSFPDLKSLYHLSKKEPSEDCTPIFREDKGYHSNFVKDVIDENTTAKILKWTKAQGIKVTGTLFAALLLAVKRVVKPDFDEFTAVIAVNIRSSFSPPVSNEVLTLLRNIMTHKCSIQNENFASLAKKIHQSVHQQLQSGEHVFNLKSLEKRLSRYVSPKEMWQRAKLPDNAILLTNIGDVKFSGKYGNLSLNELFFVSNIDCYIEKPTNFILGTLTFQGKIFSSLWFIEELVDESVGQKILSEMKEILSSL